MSLRALCSIVVGMMLPLLSQSQSVDEGKALLKSGKFAEARSMFETILKNDDNNAGAHGGLGQVFLNHKYSGRDVEKAADEFERATEIDPKSAEYQFLYGAAVGERAQTAGIFKQAFLAPKVKKAFVRAVELDPSMVEARIGLAQYYLIAPSLMGGDDAAGWKQLDEAIKLDELAGRTAKAAMLIRSKKNDEAENEYKLLAASRPNDWRVWHRYGYFCFYFKRYDEAVRHFNKYVELRPDTADSYQSLAEALIKKGELERAMMNLTKSLSLDKNYVPAIVSLGEAYQAQGQKQKAKETFQWAASVVNDERYKKQIEAKLKEVE
ncbi:MAG TPA: tetratricopeptide repeat protein [Bacteroidota bacterium]|nr:tetratricopeptide repeat protein [Bacteroidota bacterium]